MSELIDNRRHRIDTLKKIIRHLHEGQPPDDVRGHLAQLVKETDPSEVAAMEQELMNEGMGAEEIQSMCDLHAQVLRDIVRQPRSHPALAPGHPVDTFGRENEALRALATELRGLFREIEGLDDEAPIGDRLNRWRGLANQLMDVEKHYQRKENLLFSHLERHGMTAPSTVMWGKDDEVRELLKAMQEVLREKDETAGPWKGVISVVAVRAVEAVVEMIEKEERILLPMALETLTPEEWGAIFRESPRFGWCLVEPGRGYEPPEAVTPRETVELPTGPAMAFPTGTLTREHLLGLFASLPVDLTFVDAEDRVAWFSEGKDRVFERSVAILGRKVQHCHPPKSVDVVERIVGDFRAGRQNVAEFWIELQGRFIHIRYFAVRDGAGTYLGTLEVTQDVTHIRGLQGERRLLQYDEVV